MRREGFFFVLNGTRSLDEAERSRRGRELYKVEKKERENGSMRRWRERKREKITSGRG